MPILNCTALVQANKSLESKRLIKAFINHVLPSVQRLNLQAKFEDLIAAEQPTEVEIYAYAAVALKMDGSTMVRHGNNLFLQRGTDRPLVKLATAAYQHCSKMPCGTPVNKAATSDAIKLLAVILGPNVQVYKKYQDHWDSEYWTHQRVSIMAVFRAKPFNQSHIKQMFPEADQISVIDGVVSWTKPSVPLVPQSTGWEGMDGVVPSPFCAECGHTQNRCDCDNYLDDRDQKCTYCGQMIGDCGEDHGDDMRYEQQCYSRGRRGSY